MQIDKLLRSRALFSPAVVRTVARGFITIVPQAHVAFREFLGMNRVRLDPGIHLNIPILHQVRKFPLAEMSWKIENMHCYTKDNVPINASGTIFGRITQPDLAAYEVNDVWKSVEAVGTSSARAIIGRYEYDRIISERNVLNQALIEIIGDSISNWGISCTRFELQDFGPQNSNVARQMEKQMEAERNRRENELNTLAHIRTAEGDKSSAILKSEGVLAAAENHAKGEFIRITKSAEAYAVSTELEAKAWKQQIDYISKSIGSTEKAVQFLLEMQRLKNLNAVAAGENNKIYFIPPNGMLPNGVSNSEVVTDMLK